MSDLNDESEMTFGVHKGKELIDVPDEWLKWFWSENRDQFRKGDGFELSNFEYRLMVYIEESFNENDLD